ncbi:hypothetical protein GGF31_004847 [Allomyces arbusculus]|nr:hypothetical protein GGF31_004847 [Allomyces arbusculus]
MLRSPAPTDLPPPPPPVLPAPSPALATCASSPDSGTASPGSPLGPLPAVQLLATPTFDAPLFSAPEAMVAVAAAPAAPTRMVTVAAEKWAAWIHDVVQVHVQNALANAKLNAVEPERAPPAPARRRRGQVPARPRRQLAADPAAPSSSSAASFSSSSSSSSSDSDSDRNSVASDDEDIDLASTTTANVDDQPWIDSDDSDDDQPLARRLPRAPTRSSSLRRRLRAQRRSTSSTAPRRPDAPVVVTAAHLRQLDVLGASVDALRRAFHAFKATREGKYAQLVTHVRAVQVLVAQAFREIEETRARVGVGEVTPRVAPAPVPLGSAVKGSGALAQLRDAIAMAEADPRRPNAAPGGVRAQVPVVTFADAMPTGTQPEQRHPFTSTATTSAAAPIRPPRPRSDTLGSLPRLASASTSSTAPPQPVIAATSPQSNMTALAQLLESADTPSLMPVWSGPSGERVGIGLQPVPERTARNHHLGLAVHKPVRAAHSRVVVPSPQNRRAPAPVPTTSAGPAASAPPPVPTTTAAAAPPPPRPFASMSSALAMPSSGPTPTNPTPSGTGAMADLATLLEYASSDPRRAPPPPLYCTRPAHPAPAPAPPGAPRNAQLAWPALGGPPGSAPPPPPTLRAVVSAPALRTAADARRGTRMGAGGGVGDVGSGARVRAPS